MANRAYRYRIYPNQAQRQLLTSVFGVTRKFYNYCLAIKNKEYAQWQQLSDEEKKQHKWLTYYDLCKVLTKLRNSEKDENGESTEWLRITATTIYRSAAEDLMKGFANFLKHGAEHPKFKKRGKCRKAFRSDRIRFKDGKISIPCIKGGIKARGKKRWLPDAKVCCATIFCEGNPLSKKAHYYVSFVVDEKIPAIYPQTGEVVGIDLGLKDAVIVSDGTKIKRERHINKKQRRMRILQRRYSHKIEYQKKRGAKKIVRTSRMQRLQQRINNLHKRIVDARRFYNHKVSNFLVSRYDKIICEDLNVKNMLKNHKLARSISDVAWNDLVRMIAYKATWSHKELIKVNPAYTSQCCSVCGMKSPIKLTLDIREWTCSNCGTKHDRDINAAKNILAKGVEKLSAPISAVVAEHTCGGAHKRGRRKCLSCGGSSEAGIMEQVHLVYSTT